MDLMLTIGSPEDAPALVALRNDVANKLTARFGEGHWSYLATEKGIINGMTNTSKTLIAKNGDLITGTLRLASKKPWAIDPAYFTKVDHPVYLTDMAVRADWQGKGVGTFMLQEVRSFAREWPAQAIRLDAYDHEAGAGEFYRKCGFREMGRVVYRKVPLIYFECLLTPFV